MSNPEENGAPTVEAQIKAAVAAAEAAKDAVIADLRSEIEGLHNDAQAAHDSATSVIASLRADVANLTTAFENALEHVSEAPKVAVEHIRELMGRIEHDIIGQAHAFYQGLKALVEKAEASV